MAFESVSAESMIEKILHLPTDVRRNMEAILILDQHWAENFSKLSKEQQSYVAGVKARAEKLPRDAGLRAASADPVALAAVTELRDRCLQYAEEKVSVAQQAHDLVSVALERLSADLRRFEAELKANGEITEDQPNYAEVPSDAEEDEYYRPQQRQGGGGMGRAAPQQPTSHRAGGGAQLPRAQSYGGGGAPMYAGGGGGGGGYGEGAAVASEVYCLCRKPDGGEMVACENPKGCKNGEWFHYECVGLPSGWTAPPTLKWYCPPCKRALQESAAEEQAHALSLTQQQQLHAQQQLKEAQARAAAAAQAALANAPQKAGANKGKAQKAAAAPLPPRPM